MARYFNPPMPALRFGTLGWLALLLMSASLFASLAGAEDGSKETDPRWNFKGWTPSVAVTLGVHATDLDGAMSATDTSGATIRIPQRGDDYAVTPMLRLSLGLETPELPSIPGHIRLFGAADYYVTFPADRHLVSEGNPTGFFVPPGFINPPQEAIEGQGSQTTNETGRSAYGFTGGMSIPFQIGDFRFFVKPGVSWMRYKWDIKGVVLAAQKSTDFAAFGREFRQIELSARGKLYSSGVGPYIAIEVEPDPWGPVLVGAFIEGAYYRTIGDRDVNISDSQTLSGNSLPTETYLGRWGMRVDQEFWRAAVGIRVYLAAD